MKFTNDHGLCERRRRHWKLEEGPNILGMDGKLARESRDLNDSSKPLDETSMGELLKIFTPEQLTRYECYRRSSLSKPALKRIFNSITGASLNPNALIVLAAVCKLHVGQIVESAREVASSYEVSDLDPLEVEHVQEAHRRIQACGDTFDKFKVIRATKL